VLNRKLNIEQDESWGELRCTSRVGSSFSTSGTRRITINDTNIIWYGNRVGHQYNINKHEPLTKQMRVQTKKSIHFMWKQWRTSQQGTENVKTW